jgi:hypothetical protein
MMKRITALMLSLVLMTTCFTFTACDGDAVRKTREAAERLVIYSDLGLKSLEELKTGGALTGFDDSYNVATTGLTEISDTTLLFVEKVKGFTKFDAKNREDLAKAFAAVSDALQRLKPKVAFLVTKVVEYLNARGITNIQDPQSVVRRVNFAIDILDASARLIQTRIAT